MTNRRLLLTAAAASLALAACDQKTAGPVTGETSGRRLMLRYRLKGPLVMHQTLERMADGTTIENTGRITLLGIPVGWLHETIRRKNP